MHHFLGSTANHLDLELGNTDGPQSKISNPGGEKAGCTRTKSAGYAYCRVRHVIRSIHIKTDELHLQRQGGTQHAKPGRLSETYIQKTSDETWEIPSPS